MGFIISRDILSAPSTSDEIRVLNIVICLVSTLSAIGAGWIILSFSVSGLPRIYHATAFRN